MLVTGISGGALDQLFSVFEFDAVDDLGEAFGVWNRRGGAISWRLTGTA